MRTFATEGCGTAVVVGPAFRSLLVGLAIRDPRMGDHEGVVLRVAGGTFTATAVGAAGITPTAGLLGIALFPIGIIPGILEGRAMVGISTLASARSYASAACSRSIACLQATRMDCTRSSEQRSSGASGPS